MAGADAELRDKLRAAFEEVDTDNSGSISHSELKTALIKSGFKPSDDDVHVGQSSVGKNLWHKNIQLQYFTLIQFDSNCVTSKCTWLG